jgi:hypothetical protein
VTPADVDGWLRELGLAPADRAERDGVTSWDLLLDGVRRQDIRVTLILDPALALLCWVHYAPPISDSFRVSYRKLLRWNDELPFVKFAVSADERPVLTAELPVGSLDRDVLGVALARLVTVCDLLLDESLRWLYPGARVAPTPGRASRHGALLARYASALGELVAPPPDPEGGTPPEATDADP